MNYLNHFLHKILKLKIQIYISYLDFYIEYSESIDEAFNYFSLKTKYYYE